MTTLKTSALILALTILCPWLLPGALHAQAPSAAVEERLARVLAENAELTRELARYRAGLKRAVAELNRLQALRLPDTLPDALPATPHQPRGEQILSVARVRVEGRRATVSGALRNDGLAVLRGRLILELLRDGHPVDAVRLPFVAAAASQTPYVHAFELEGYAAGSYAARARLEY